jgi:hypothetical protein
MALILKRTPDSSYPVDYDVFSGEVRLGRITLVELTGGIMRWQWNIYAIRGPADRVTHGGFANTLDEAETAFAANVRRFLELAEWLEIEPPSIVLLDPVVIDPELGRRAAFLIGTGLALFFMRLWIPESPRYNSLKKT